MDKDSHLVTDRKLVTVILNDQHKSVFLLEPDEVYLPVFIDNLIDCFGDVIRLKRNLKFNLTHI